MLHPFQPKRLTPESNHKNLSPFRHIVTARSRKKEEAGNCATATVLQWEPLGPAVAQNVR
jgi:hypothetical protein